MRCRPITSVSVTGPGLRVQSVVMPFGDPESWTLVDRDAAVVEPVEVFVSHLHAVERSPNTVKAYAHDLRDWFEFLDQRGLEWTRVRLEDVGRFVAWLRLPAAARAGNVAALPTVECGCAESTVNRKLSASPRLLRPVRCPVGHLRVEVGNGDQGCVFGGHARRTAARGQEGSHLATRSRQGGPAWNNRWP